MPFSGGTDTKFVAGIDTSKTYTPASGASTVTDMSNVPFTLGQVVTRKGVAGLPCRYKFVLVEDLALVAGLLLSLVPPERSEVTS